MGKDELKHRVMNYTPDIELDGSGNVDYGHNLADAIMKVYNPQIMAVHGQVSEENKIRMEINCLKKNPEAVKEFYLNKMLAEVEEKIHQNN
jgi:hypothetical protein